MELSVDVLGVGGIPSVAYRVLNPQIPHLHTASYCSSLLDKPDKASALVRMGQFLCRFSRVRADKYQRWGSGPVPAVMPR
jgi:hypothetical protein